MTTRRKLLHAVRDLCETLPPPPAPVLVDPTLARRRVHAAIEIIERHVRLQGHDSIPHSGELRKVIDAIGAVGKIVEVHDVEMQIALDALVLEVRRAITLYTVRADGHTSELRQAFRDVNLESLHEWLGTALDTGEAPERA